MSARIDIVPARVTHIGPIANRMRGIDVTECSAYGHSPKRALRDGFFYSEKVWTALVNERPEAMFGVYVPSALGGIGHPWMLGTDATYDHGRDLIRLGPGYLLQMCDSINRLRNLVCADNDKAIRLLIKWGFEVSPEIQMIGGVQFRAFEKCVIRQL